MDPTTSAVFISCEAKSIYFSHFFVNNLFLKQSYSSGYLYKKRGHTSVQRKAFGRFK